MLKACSISYTVHLVTPCVCVRGTVDTFFRPWQMLWRWHFRRHYFRFFKLLSKRWTGSKEHYLLGRNTMCESLIKRITPKICMLCFALINSILCNLSCVRVLFENANSPCFRFFSSKLHCELCLVCIGLSDAECRNTYTTLRIYLLHLKPDFATPKSSGGLAALWTVLKVMGSN